MTVKNKHQQRNITSREYEAAKKDLVEALRNQVKSKESKLKMSIAGKSRWEKLTTEQKFFITSTGGKAHAAKLSSDKLYAEKYKAKQCNKRFKLTEDQKLKISSSKVGKLRSDELKKKLSDIRLLDPKLHCEYCNKEIQRLNFSRWHGEKCKFKNKI